MSNQNFGLLAARLLLALATAALVVAGAAKYRTPIGVLAAAQPKSTQLQQVLAQMNAASARFTGAQADLKQELFTKVVHDTETSIGQIYFIRKGGATEMGTRLLAPDAAPGNAPVKIVQFKGGILQVLNPGTATVDRFAASGKNQATAETILSLGFGGSGTDLEKSWTITDQGSEQMSDGSKQVQVEKLDLVSTNPTIRNTYSHITIWVDPVRDVSLKQVSFDASSGDTRTVYYSNIRLQPPANTSSFAIQCGKQKCTVVNH